MQAGTTCQAFLEDDFSAQLYEYHWHVYCVCACRYTLYIYTDVHHRPDPFKGIQCQVKAGPTFFLLKNK